MPPAKILDCYSIFPMFWQSVKHLPVANQIEKWDNFYMVKWPKLRNKIKKKYKDQGYDWFSVAEKYVFPKIPNFVDDYLTIGDILTDVIPSVYKRMMTLFNLEIEVIFIIYVGIGHGAGWATSFDQKPAILFGIENAAEEKWTSKKILEPLTAHELGHILHHYWRQEGKLAIDGHSPLWTLYEEGFAMRLEHLTMGFESWHEQQTDKGWLLWCQMNKAWLAEEFLNRLEQNDEEVLRPFFGSWYDIKGMKQTGYYLGHEIIKHLEQKYSIQEISVFTIPEIEHRISEVLQILSKKV